jgi:DNA/RNA-binding domain of Phe-tRNA-synthetase-like protein
MFTITEAWKTAYPDAHAGVLVMQSVDNPSTHPELERLKQNLEGRLRAQFAGKDRGALESFSTIPAYAAYYRKFKKTYHVQGQLESIAFKGKSIPNVAALVEAMFMAEVKNLLLTAGHDFDRLDLPVTLSVARGSERYTLLRGQEQVLKTDDMFMSDRSGVISSIVYGPDRRTQIRAETRNVLYAVYAPAGIPAAAVQTHLQDIRDYVRIVSPDAAVHTLQIVGEGPKQDRPPLHV